MSLYEDLKSGGYLDPQYGMVSIYPHNGNGPNCDNYWLYTAIAVRLSGRGAGWNNIDLFYAACVVRTGLILRFPTRKTDDVSQQELAASAVLNANWADRVNVYGWAHLFCFNAANPGVFQWKYMYARFLDFMPFTRMSSFKWITPIGQILWSIGIITTALSAYGDTSEKVYKWMQIENIRGLHLITSFAIGIWVRLMERKYAGGPKELFSIYFPPGHPFIKYAPTKF